jgi:hypothetical protein
LIGKTDSVSHAQRRFSEIRSALSKIFAKTVRQAASSSGLMSLMSESRIANCVLNLIDPLHQGLGSGREFNDPGPAIMLGCPAQNQAVGFQIAQHASQRGLLDTHAFRQLRLIDPVPKHRNPVQCPPSDVALAHRQKGFVHDIAPTARDKGQALRERVLDRIIKLMIAIHAA